MNTKVFSTLHRGIASMVMLLPTLASAGEVEVLHFWTSGGEQAAMEVLKENVQASGHDWKEFTVAGGGGGNALSTLHRRVLMRQPPTTAILKSGSLRTWARLNYLANLDEVASADHWDAHLPPAVAESMKFEGHYIATPVNVHRTNWMWINKRILDEVGGQVPTTWGEFEILADRIQAAGHPVIAHGDQPWQDATLFESVVLGVGGADFYRHAFVKHDRNSLRSDTWIRIMEQMYRLRRYLSDDLPGQDWNQATAAVIDGRAAFQFMGDWAKGEFRLAGKRPGEDYICAPVPGTQGKFIFNIDSFAMFRLEDSDSIDAQNALARSIMNDRFQASFNQAKGSIPARTDIPLDDFDDCARYSHEDFVLASGNGDLVPSIAHGMATTERISTSLTETVAEIWSSDLEPEDAMWEIGKSIRYGTYLLN